MKGTMLLVLLSVDQIDPNPRQPRRSMGAQQLEELAESIRSSGLVQPIIVRRHGHRYQIIVGERRWRASKMAGLQNIPAIVKEASDSVLSLEALIENIQRQDLTSIERENAIYELWKSRGYESHAGLAKALIFRIFFSP